MADLFYSVGNDLESQIELLKTDILTYAKTLGYKKKSLPLLHGKAENMSNNILIVQPPFKGKKHFSDDEFKALIYTMGKFGILNYFVTYSHPVPLERHTKNEIKKFSTWMSKLIEMISPKLIVALGEEAELVFFRRKFILRDFHGTVVDQHAGIPVMISFPFDYYASKSSYEDRSYKKYIQDTDWTAIKEEYDRRITCQ